MKSYNPILFDLDGTLTDPGEGIRNSVAHALQYYGIQMSTAELNRFIGPPLAEGFREFCGFSAGQAAEAVEHYREYYREKGMLENRVYDGIPALLAHLRGAGKVLAVATSKPEVFARQILHHYGLDGNFQVIAGSELDGSRSKKHEVAAYALSQCPLPADGRAVLVGDRRHDVEGARQASIDAVGVTFGYGSEEELLSAGAPAIAHSVAELEQILLSIY